jgi:hypothetical protein
MPTISKEQFLQIADHLAYQYEKLIELETKQTKVSTNAKWSSIENYQPNIFPIFTDDDVIFLRLKNPELYREGLNLKCFTYEEVNQKATTYKVGNVIYVRYKTGPSGEILTTANQLRDHLRYFDIFDILEPERFLSGNAVEVDFNIYDPLTDGYFDLEMKVPGLLGNLYTVEFSAEGIADSSLTHTITGRDIKFILGKNSSNEISTSIGELDDYIKSDRELDSLLTIILKGFVMSQVPVRSKANFKGGTNNDYVSTIVSEPPGESSHKADSDVVLMTTIAQQADLGLKATNYSKSIGHLEAIQSALDLHMSRTGATSVQQYLIDNDLRVHENYSIVQGQRTSFNLDAITVFKKESKEIALFQAIEEGDYTLISSSPIGTGSGKHTSTNYAASILEACYIPHLVSGEYAYGASEDNNALTIKAIPGRFGRYISVEIVEGDANPLSSSVTEQGDGTWIIEITLTKPSSTVTTTAEQLMDYINENLTDYFTAEAASEDLSGICTTADFTFSNSAAGPLKNVTAIFDITAIKEDGDPETCTNILFTEDDPISARKIIASTAHVHIPGVGMLYSKLPGDLGNNQIVRLLDPEAPDSELTYTVNGEIVINLATDGSSQITTTLKQLTDMIKSSKDLSSRIFLSSSNDETLVIPQEELILVEGTVPSRYLSVETVTPVLVNLQYDCVKIFTKVERPLRE